MTTPVRRRRKIAKVIGLTLLGIVLLVAGAGVAMIGPSNIIGMLRYDQREKGTLQVGGAAPDVTMTSLDGKTPVRMAERIGPRPLVLVFGSFT